MHTWEKEKFQINNLGFYLNSLEKEKQNKPTGSDHSNITHAWGVPDFTQQEGNSLHLFSPYAWYT